MQSDGTAFTGIEVGGGDLTSYRHLKKMLSCLVYHRNVIHVLGQTGNPMALHNSSVRIKEFGFMTEMAPKMEPVIFIYAK